LQAWIKQAVLKPEDFLFPSRLHDSPHLGTRQYARILGHWLDELGLDHLRAVQLLLGHSKLDYLPYRTMSRRTCDHHWPALRFAGHRPLATSP
jgi:hypothetical protein